MLELHVGMILIEQNVSIPLLPVDISEPYSNKEIPDRYNCDTKVNEGGTELLELCKTIPIM